MNRNSWRDISTRRPRGTDKRPSEYNKEENSKAGSTVVLGSVDIKSRIRSAIAERIIDGHKSSIQYLKGRITSTASSDSGIIVEPLALPINIEEFTQEPVKTSTTTSHLFAGEVIVTEAGQ